MKISLLCADLSSNCLGRTYLLAKILQKNYQVEIVGPMFGNDIWSPVAHDLSVPYKKIQLKKWFPYVQLYKLALSVDGDIVYATKPHFTSYLLGLYIKLKARKKLILDIDDWEIGFLKESIVRRSLLNNIKYFARTLVMPYYTDAYFPTLILSKLYKLADAITVSNTFLQKHYGGIIIWHARDENQFNPKKNRSVKIKIELDVLEKKIILFLGTARQHKGVDDLIQAVHLLNRNDTVLLLVGIDIRESYACEIIRLGEELLGDTFKYVKEVPFDKISEYISCADIVVIPQKESEATKGQMPAKVFDAMAMAKGIVATDVSDLAYVLANAGIIAAPNNPEDLMQKISSIIDNPNKIYELGAEARKKFIENYSYAAVGKNLCKTICYVEGTKRVAN